MIQRTLLRQFKAAAARLAPTSFLAGSVIRSTQSFTPVPRLAIAARCYATNGETKAAEENASSTEDAIAKEVEAKNKEIVDLKVCRRQLPVCSLPSLSMDVL